MEKKSKCSRFLTNIDIFGQPISFYINGDTKYKTSFGGIITILMTIIIMIVTLSAFISLINKSQMTVTKDTTFATNPPIINLTPQNFMFAVGVADPYVTLNQSIFSYNAGVYFQNQTNQNWSNIQIDLGPCRPQDYGDTFYQFAIDFTKYLCPTNFSVNLFGSYANAAIQYIFITIEKCTNGTNPYVTCASDDKINQYFRAFGYATVILAFTNKVVDMQNQTHPFKFFLDIQSLKVNPLSQLEYDTSIYLRSNQILSYDDIFGIVSPNVYNGTTYEKERTDNVVIPSADYTRYVVFNLLSSNYQNYYTRKYDTFLNALAYIGGIVNLLTMLAGLIGGAFNSYKCRIRMVNELYDFDFKDYNNNKKDKKNIYKPNENYTLSIKVQVNDQSDNLLIKQKFEKMKNIRNKLAFNFSDFIKSILCRSHSKAIKIKNELFNLANNQLNKDLDVLWLIKRIQEIDKLKTILLYPNKLKIFEFIPPPIISSSGHPTDLHEITKYMWRNTRENCEAKQLILVNKNNNTYQDLDGYYKCSETYSNLKNKKDKISKNIIRSLDPEIIEIFNLIEKANHTQESNQLIKDTPVNLNINGNRDLKDNINSKEIDGLDSVISREQENKFNLLSNKNSEKSDASLNIRCFTKHQKGLNQDYDQIIPERILHKDQNHPLNQLN